MNYLLDNNIIIDYYNDERSKKYPESVDIMKYGLGKENFFVSSSSFDNIAYTLAKYMKDEYGYTLKQRKFLASKVVEYLIQNFTIAKTPSYIEIDHDDIEDSQIIASAKAIDAKVLTRDQKMLEKHPDITISPKELIKTSNFKLQTSNFKKIDFANLKKQYFRYQPEIEREMDRVLNSASYIMGDAVKTLENNLQEFTGAKHAITCSSGTDALLLAMMALDIQPGDEIITTPFTFIATAETIALLGAKPVFVDIDEKTYNIDPAKIEAAITEKTKAIMPVSLYGQPADLDAIYEVIDKLQETSVKSEVASKNPKLSTSNFKLQTSNSNKIHLIVDGAQSFGATYKGRSEVHYCDIYTTSFFPAKPLGCYGDGGAVFTNDDALAEKIRMLRVHGQNKRYRHKYIGLGARLDTLQAAVLNVKLKHYPQDLKRRQEVAEKYTKALRQKLQDRSKTPASNTQLPTSNFKLQTSSFQLPTLKSDRTSTWAQYSIRVQNRDQMQVKLKEQGIPTAVHYPMPLHLQECFAYLGYKAGDFPVAERASKEILSLPMNPYLSDQEITHISEAL